MVSDPIAFGNRKTYRVEDPASQFSKQRRLAMFKPLETLENAQTPIYQTPLLLGAVIICDRLENAGIPAILRQTRCPGSGHFEVDVPQAYAAEAVSLLSPEPARGEILCAVFPQDNERRKDE
jgi:hypothetical protein